MPPPVRLEGHTYPIYSLAFSPDGRLLASGDYGSLPGAGIRLWDTRRGRLIRKLETAQSGRATGAGSLAFSPDGRRLAAGGIDAAEETRVWDLTSGQPTHTFTESDTAVCFSPDGRLLACGRDDMLLRDGRTGVELARLVLDIPPEEAEETQWVDLLCFSPDGRRLAASCFMGGYGLGLIWVWDVARRTRLATLRAESLVRALHFSADGLTLSAASLHTVQTWEGKSLEEQPERQHLLPDEMAGYGLTALRGDRLAAANSDTRQPSITVVDLATGQLDARLTHTPLEEAPATLLALALSPDGHQLAAAFSTDDLETDYVLLWTLDSRL